MNPHECTFTASGFSREEFEHFVAIIDALGIKLEYNVSKSGRTATVHIFQMPSIYDAEVMRTRHAGRPSKGITLPRDSIFNSDTTCAEFLEWLKTHTAADGMQQLGLPRTTYFRRVKAIKAAVNEAERMNVGRIEKGIKPLRPLLTNIR